MHQSPSSRRPDGCISGKSGWIEAAYRFLLCASKDDGAESCSVPFCDRVLFGIETNNEAWPVPKLNRPVTDKEFSLPDCFGVVGANQGLEPYKVAVKTNGISSVVCHRSHPALKTQLAARASRGLYTSEHNSNGIFKIKGG
jgi:hypothetical protein